MNTDNDSNITVHLPLKTQEAMSRLLLREKTRWTGGVEFGFDLMLRRDSLFPGMLRKGSNGRIYTPIMSSALGFFHTHPMDTASPYFSETDVVDVFLRPHRRILGVGHPDYSTSEVSFITLTKAPPTELVLGIIDDLVGILDESVHISELEEYYTIYNFTLGAQILSLDVLAGWTPPRLPPGWWRPKETLEEYVRRKVG